MEAISLIFGDRFNPKEFDLDGTHGLFGETATPLRGFQNTYTLAGRSITGLARPAREITLDVKVWRDEGVQTLKRLMREASVQMDDAPARIRVDGWEQKCQVPKIDVSDVRPRLSTVSMTIVLLEGFWLYTGETVSVVRAAQSEVALDHEYDFEHDYAGMSSAAYVGAAGNPLDAVDMLVGLRFYGPCSNPAVTINETRYQVSTDVPDGGYVTVDPRTREVILTPSNGTTSSVFDKAVRGGGLGSGSYIFEPQPPERLEVAYSGEFDFDVIPYYRRQHLW